MSDTWFESVRSFRKYVVQIKTPDGEGTGFVFACNEKYVVIITANHVTEKAKHWLHPIRIIDINGRELFIGSWDDPSRTILLPEPKWDFSLIAISKSFISENSEDFVSEISQSFQGTLPLVEEGYYQEIGVEVGWLGFPAIYPNHLCFFKGNLSCWIEEQKLYLVDGVAIHGVSGGPVFSLNPFKIVGLISDYIPNVTTGTPMPGLSVARDMNHAHNLRKVIENDQQKT